LEDTKGSFDAVIDYISSMMNALTSEITFISIIIDNVYKIVKKVMLVLALLIVLCLIPFFIYTPKLIYERVFFASIGVLTFISIFYSLLVSETGKNVINNINESIERTKKKVEKASSEEINKKDIHNPSDLISIEKVKIEATSILNKLEIIKNLIDVEQYLTLTVFFLLISIILSIFDVPQLQQSAYAFFAGGFVLSGVIVILWRSFPTMINTLEINLKIKKEEKDMSIQ